MAPTGFKWPRAQELPLVLKSHRLHCPRYRPHFLWQLPQVFRWVASGHFGLNGHQVSLEAIIKGGGFAQWVEVVRGRSKTNQADLSNERCCPAQHLLYTHFYIKAKKAIPLKRALRNTLNCWPAFWLDCQWMQLVDGRAYSPLNGPRSKMPNKSISENQDVIWGPLLFDTLKHLQIPSDPNSFCSFEAPRSTLPNDIT